jgi:hypothetical protein
MKDQTNKDRAILIAIVLIVVVLVTIQTVNNMIHTAKIKKNIENG